MPDTPTPHKSFLHHEVLASIKALADAAQGKTREKLEFAHQACSTLIASHTREAEVGHTTPHEASLAIQRTLSSHRLTILPACVELLSSRPPENIVSVIRYLHEWSEQLALPRDPGSAGKINKHHTKIGRALKTYEFEETGKTPATIDSVALGARILARYAKTSVGMSGDAAYQIELEKDDDKGRR